jgi:hypothetical protein
VLTKDEQLLTVDTANTAAIVSNQAITGIQAGEQLVGIDVRPATGELYALSAAGNLYTVDPRTGAATLKAALTADPADTTEPFTALAGTDFGIDFNPVPDRLRVVSDADQNLRINPDTGAVTTDTPIAYDPGDVSSAANPNLVDVAYTNNMAGATTTTLLGLEGLDPALNNMKLLPDGSTAPALSLVRQGGVDGNPSPNTGLLTTVGPFGRDGVLVRGLDIAPDGIPYVGVELQFPGVTDKVYEIVTINPDSGVDTALGRVGDGTIAFEDLAVLPSIQFSARMFAATEGSNGTVTVTRSDGGTAAVEVDFSTISATAIAGVDFTPVTQRLTFAAGEISKTVDVPVLTDGSTEEDELLVVNLSNPGPGGALGATSSAVVRISANDDFDDLPPQVRQVLLTGPSRGISGATVQFSEDMNESTVENLANYTFTARGRGRITIALTSANYDPATRTVVLAASQTFAQTEFKTLEFKVKGKSGGVQDMAGNRLDGTGRGRPGSDSISRFAVFSGTTITLTDRDGDQGTLTLANGGRLDGIVPVKNKNRGQRTQFWILDPVPLRSTLTGSVTKGTTGDGIIVIAEIIGLDKKDFTPLLSSTSFRVNTLTFSSNATGIG